MMEKEKKVKICPSAEELEDECKTNVACPIVGCAKTFAQPSALRFHVVKVHKIISNDTDARLANRKRCELECRQFHCPAEGCVYNEQRAKHFTSYKALKQHYLKVHAVKKFKCPSCGSQFGVRSDLNRHLVNFCSEDLSCTTCKIHFTDRRTLLNHCSMTGHSTPEMRPKSRPKPANVDPSKDRPSLVLQSEKQTLSMNCESNALESEKIPNASNCTAVSDNISSLLDSSSTIVSSSISSTIFNNPGRSKVPGSHSFKTLVPKPSCRPVPSQLEAGKNYVLVYTLPSSLKRTSTSMLKSLAPKPGPICNFETQKNSILNVDKIPVDQFISCSDSRGLNDQQRSNDYQFKTISTQTNETRGHEIQVAETQTIRGHEIQVAETQTIRGHGIQVAETQTTEHFLARSLSGNRLSQSKESRGSQVSPRAKEKQGTQSSHTQTLGDSFRVRRRRRTRSTNGESNVEMSTVSIESDPSYMAWMIDDQWPDLTNNQTQTMNILNDFEASIAESISTQTLESYLVDNLFDAIQQNSQDPSQPTTMFQQTMQDVSNHSFIRSPISPSNAGMNDGMPPTFQRMENNFLSDVIPTLNSNFTTENAGDVNLVALDPRYDTISCQTAINCSAETQTSDLPESLINFQPDFDASLMHMETQTADDCDLLDIFSNMETQTGDDFFSDLGFSDIETQTHHWDDWCTVAATAQTQTTFQGIGSSFLLDMETQTCFKY